MLNSTSGPTSDDNAAQQGPGAETVPFLPHDDSVAPENHRRWFRVELPPGLTVPALLVHDGQELPVFIKNQSFNGMGLTILHRFAENLAPGDSIEIRYGSESACGVICHITSGTRSVEIGVDTSINAS